MKIDIDLKEIFVGDGEDGSEVEVNEAIKKAVINAVSKKLIKQIDDDTKRLFKETIDKQIVKRVNTYMDTVLATIMDEEYEPTNSWGGREKKTTLRNRITDAVKDSLVLQKDVRWDNDKNAFTKVVNETITNRMKEFLPQITQVVNAEFTQQAFTVAQTKLQEKLGIKVA